MTLPASGSSLPPVQVEAFEGPLDLLLDEVRRQNVAIESIAMAPIVARFLAYVRTAAERNLNLDIEWLHMAATLIHWKSRSLLPPDASEEPQRDPIRDDLVQQLLAHRKAGGRGAGPPPGRRGDPVFPGRGRRRIRACRASHGRTRRAGIRERLGSDPAGAGAGRAGSSNIATDRRRWRESFGVEQDDVTVSEMMDYLRDQLAAADGRLDGVGLLESQATASRRSCLFLGMLEMARDQQVELQQEEVFGPNSAD